MANTPLVIPDPRGFVPLDETDAASRRLYELARAALDAATAADAGVHERALVSALNEMLEQDAAEVATLVDAAPSADVARHLWRAVEKAWAAGAYPVSGQVDPTQLDVTLFALPVVIVAGLESGASVTLPGTLTDADKLAEVMRSGGALRGNRAFALAEVLVGPESLGLASLPRLRAWQHRLAVDGPGAAIAADALLEPAPITIDAGAESVHLRFLVGSAIAAVGVDLLAESEVGRWGLPLAQELGHQLRAGPATILALPRLPRRPLAALQLGRVAQREVSAAVFVGNALRRLRPVAGEPAAVLSAHRVPGVSGGGELRLSLSSPLAPRDAEGFRCPLHPFDRVTDVARMLVDLLRDCRVADIRVLAGVHADRDPSTGLRLLFKPETIPFGNELTLH